MFDIIQAALQAKRLTNFEAFSYEVWAHLQEMRCGIPNDPTTRTELMDTFAARRLEQLAKRTLGKRAKLRNDLYSSGYP